jgi:hypothetical protein
MHSSDISRRENVQSCAFSCLKIESGFKAHSTAELASQVCPAVELGQSRPLCLRNTTLKPTWLMSALGQ